MTELQKAEDRTRRTRGARVARRKQFEEASRSFPRAPSHLLSLAGKNATKRWRFLLLLKDYLLQMKGTTGVKKGEIKELFRNVLTRLHNLVSCKADGHAQGKPDHFFFSCHMVKKIHFQIKFYRFPVWAMQWMGELEQFSTSSRWSTGSTNLVDWH